MHCTRKSQIANRIIGRSSPLTLLGPIGSLARFAKICYLPASRSWTSICQQRYQTRTCNAIATYWRKFSMPTVHKFALPYLYQVVRFVSLSRKFQNFENPTPDICVRAPLRNDSRFSATCCCLVAVSVPADVWVACAVFVAGLYGLEMSGPVRLSAACGQRHGGQLTVHLLLSSLSDSTGLGHLAPLGCVQPPQLSGNGG